jgi:hypothetical protein
LDPTNSTPPVGTCAIRAGDPGLGAEDSMATKPTLASAGNVLVPAYLALKQKGYSVRCEVSGDEETWYAESPSCLFVAEDPLTLLGIVALYETRGEDWRASDAEIDAFFARYGYS